MGQDSGDHHPWGLTTVSVAVQQVCQPRHEAATSSWRLDSRLVHVTFSGHNDVHEYKPTVFNLAVLQEWVGSSQAGSG